ncbi:MAG TPA: porin [Afipia sp.]
MKNLIPNNSILALGVFLVAGTLSPALLAAAERDQPGDALGRALKSKPAESGSASALRAARNNPCAEFGAGFVRIEGSSTCIRAGGNIRIDVGGQR